jgi:hypothetical protein
MSALYDDRQLYPLGKLHLKALRTHPEDHWCSRSIKLGNREHEAYVMEVCLAYWPHKFLTGAEVDPALQPDATLVIDGKACHVEIDTGTMSREQVQARWKKYEGNKDDKLIVCPDDSRIERAMRWSKALGEHAYFAIIEHVVASPYGRIWTGLDGGKYAIHEGGNEGRHEGGMVAAHA